jgi:hypothetical protein
MMIALRRSPGERKSSRKGEAFESGERAGVSARQVAGIARSDEAVELAVRIPSLPARAIPKMMSPRRRRSGPHREERARPVWAARNGDRRRAAEILPMATVGAGNSAAAEAGGARPRGPADLRRRLRVRWDAEASRKRRIRSSSEGPAAGRDRGVVSDGVPRPCRSHGRGDDSGDDENDDVDAGSARSWVFPSFRSGLPPDRRPHLSVRPPTFFIFT